MNNEVIIGGALILLGMVLSARSLFSGVTADLPAPQGGGFVGEGQGQFLTLQELYHKYGNIYGIEPALLRAIAIVESNENPNAKNPTDPSIGLMQVLCQADNPDEPCRNRLNVTGWNNATQNRLYDPEFNVSIAAQILAWNIDNYGFERGIAVYNHWGARSADPNGPFPNQAYVDKILREYGALSIPF